MTTNYDLAARFEADRPHLRGVAYRLEGSLEDSDDAVQRAWLKASQADLRDVDNLTGCLRRSLPGSASTCCGPGNAERKYRWMTSQRPQRYLEPKRKRYSPNPLAWRCWLSWSGSRPLNGLRSCCTTSSRSPSTRWARRSTDHPPPQRSSPAGRESACSDTARTISALRVAISGW